VAPISPVRSRARQSGPFFGLRAHLKEEEVETSAAASLLFFALGGVALIPVPLDHLVGLIDEALALGNTPSKVLLVLLHLL
jgi:hypothetical protein